MKIFTVKSPSVSNNKTLINQIKDKVIFSASLYNSSTSGETAFSGKILFCSDDATVEINPTYWKEHQTVDELIIFLKTLTSPTQANVTPIIEYIESIDFYNSGKQDNQSIPSFRKLIKTEYVTLGVNKSYKANGHGFIYLTNLGIGSGGAGTVASYNNNFTMKIDDVVIAKRSYTSNNGVTINISAPPSGLMVEFNDSISAVVGDGSSSYNACSFYVMFYE